MAFNWQTAADGRIFDTKHHLETSHGPALAVLNNKLYIVYVGESSSTLWYAWIDGLGAPFPPTTNTDVLCEGNYPIKTVEGHSPKSSYTPAIAVVDGILHIVYAGSNTSTHSLWWAWFDGRDWHGDIKIATMNSEPKPTLATRGNDHVLHLVYEDSVQTTTLQTSQGPRTNVPSLQHRTSIKLDAASMANWSAQSWGVAEQIGYGSFPALTHTDEPPTQFPGRPRPSTDLQLFVKYAGPDGNPAPLATGILHDTGSVNLAEITAAQPPYSDGGETGALFNGKLYLVYRGSGKIGVNMWYLTYDPAAAQPGNDPVQHNGHTLQASAVPALANFRGLLCLAYKRDNTSDLQLTWTS